MSAQFPNPAEMYEQFYGPGIFQPLTEAFARFASPQKGERVLDLACGTGLVARHIAPLIGTEGKITAVDINPVMLAVARQQTPPAGASIEWLEGDATQLDLKTEFDLVLCQQGLQFFSDKSAALKQMRQLLVKGGRIGIATWQAIEQHKVFEEFAKVEVRHLAPLGVSYEDLLAPFSLHDVNQIRSFLAEAGFSKIEITPHTIQTRFPDPKTFARKMETAYGAVIPAFVQNPDAFLKFLDAVENETRDLVAQYTQGEIMTFPMIANLTIAYVE